MDGPGRRVDRRRPVAEARRTPRGGEHPLTGPCRRVRDAVDQSLAPSAGPRSIARTAVSARRPPSRGERPRTGSASRGSQVRPATGRNTTSEAARRPRSARPGAPRQTRRRESRTSEARGPTSVEYVRRRSASTRSVSRGGALEQRQRRRCPPTGRADRRRTRQRARLRTVTPSRPWRSTAARTATARTALGDRRRRAGRQPADGGEIPNRSAGQLGELDLTPESACRSSPIRRGGELGQVRRGERERTAENLRGTWPTRSGQVEAEDGRASPGCTRASSLSSIGARQPGGERHQEWSSRQQRGSVAWLAHSPKARGGWPGGPRCSPARPIRPSSYRPSPDRPGEQREQLCLLSRSSSTPLSAPQVPATWSEPVDQVHLTGVIVRPCDVWRRQDQ